MIIVRMFNLINRKLLCLDSLISKVMSISNQLSTVFFTMESAMHQCCKFPRWLLICWLRCAEEHCAATCHSFSFSPWRSRLTTKCRVTASCSIMLLDFCSRGDKKKSPVNKQKRSNPNVSLQDWWYQKPRRIFHIWHLPSCNYESLNISGEENDFNHADSAAQALHHRRWRNKRKKNSMDRLRHR